MTKELLQRAWKQGDEYLPYHPQASHVNPDHRDGWNACYKAAIALPEQRADDIHSCSFFCKRLECIETQRDLLRDTLIKKSV